MIFLQVKSCIPQKVLTYEVLDLTDAQWEVSKINQIKHILWKPISHFSLFLHSCPRSKSDPLSAFEWFVCRLTT